MNKKVISIALGLLIALSILTVVSAQSFVNNDSFNYDLLAQKFEDLTNQLLNKNVKNDIVSKTDDTDINENIPNKDDVNKSTIKSKDADESVNNNETTNNKSVDKQDSMNNSEDSNSEPKLESKPEPKSESKSHPVPESKPEPKPQPDPEPKPEPKSEPKPMAPTSSSRAYEKEVIRLVNVEREKVDLKPLTENSSLSTVARYKSQDMINNSYFAHNSPTYGSPFDMMKHFGISYRTAGENIAAGQRTPESVVTAWMNSPGHKANILHKSFTQIGVGFIKDKNGYSYWTQMFISPR